MVLSKLPRLGERFDIRLYENRVRTAHFRTIVRQSCVSREKLAEFTGCFYKIIEILLASTQLRVTRRFPRIPLKYNNSSYWFACAAQPISAAV